jgi:transglutaminase-like putative cysteine protease
MGLLSEYGSDDQRDADLLRVDFLDHDTVDWSGIRRTTYRVQQRFHYEYAAPICNLRQRLMVVPRPVHGDQRLLSHRVDASAARFHKQTRRDRFGNFVLGINIPEVEEVVDFDVSVLVERSPGQRGHLEGATGQPLEVYRLPSALTQPDSVLRAAAAELACSGETGGDLAAAVSSWVYGRMSYGFDRTGVHTTAGEALATGQGVCQDYAHVMLALCRLLDIPARYVSGHLVGEGGTHAWVEVLLGGPGQSVEVLAWDPTHDRRADLRYLTVAVGRDYRDVAPASGTYCLPHQGWLSASCRVGVAQLESEMAA